MKNKILIIFIVFSLIGVGSSVFLMKSNMFLDLENAVYVNEEETELDCSLETGAPISSVKIKLVNISNKDFVDYKVRLMYYNDFSPNQGSYPEGYSLYKTISIKANETKFIEFNEFRNVWHYNENFRISFEYEKEKDPQGNTSDTSYWQALNNGKELNNMKLFKYIPVISLVLNASITIGLVIILIVNLKKK